MSYGNIVLVLTENGIKPLDLGFDFLKCANVFMQTIFTSIRNIYTTIKPCRELQNILQLMENQINVDHVDNNSNNKNNNNRNGNDNRNEKDNDNDNNNDNKNGNGNGVLFHCSNHSGHSTCQSYGLRFLKQHLLHSACSWSFDERSVQLQCSSVQFYCSYRSGHSTCQSYEPEAKIQLSCSHSLDRQEIQSLAESYDAEVGIQLSQSCSLDMQ